MKVLGATEATRTKAVYVIGPFRLDVNDNVDSAERIRERAALLTRNDRLVFSNAPGKPHAIGWSKERGEKLRHQPGRKRDGMSPNCRRKARLKYDKSLKPASRAISEILRLPLVSLRKSSIAFSRRFSRTCWENVRPVALSRR